MSSSLATQTAAMDSLAWRVSYEWNRAKNRQLTMTEMQQVWQDSVAASADYQGLAFKRKEAIRFLWHHTRNRILAENQVYGWWANGSFYHCWTDLPETFKCDDSLLQTLPRGHFWLDGNRKATAIRYFIPADRAAENRCHYLQPADAATAAAMKKH
jgi:hypothetical protein